MLLNILMRRVTEDVRSSFHFGITSLKICYTHSFFNEGVFGDKETKNENRNEHENENEQHHILNST